MRFNRRLRASVRGLPFKCKSDTTGDGRELTSSRGKSGNVHRIGCLLIKCTLFAESPHLVQQTGLYSPSLLISCSVTYVVARVREGQLDLGRSAVVFYSEMDTIPTRFASYWVSEKGADLRYRNSKGFDLSSLEEIRAVSGLDSKWYWLSP